MNSEIERAATTLAHVREIGYTYESVEVLTQNNNFTYENVQIIVILRGNSCLS